MGRRPGADVTDLARRGRLASAAKHLALIALMIVFVGRGFEPAGAISGSATSPGSAVDRP